MFSRSVGRGRLGILRRIAPALLSLGVVLTSVLATAPVSSAASPVVDPDDNSTELTGWYWQQNATPAQIVTILNQGYRIVGMEATSSSPTFSVTYVYNGGVYGRGWWWNYNMTANDLGTFLNANNARPVDIEPYQTASGLRFAAVMVSNTGVVGKGYWWFYDQTAASIGAFLAVNNARIVDFDRYSTAAGDRFDVILLPNTGVDGTAWWYGFNQTTTAIGASLKANNARLIRMEHTPSGGYDFVMVASPNAQWWWTYGQTAGSLNSLASQRGARIFQAMPYMVGGTRYFAALMLNDLDAESSRIRDLASPQMTGQWGFYVKKIGGGDVVGLQADTVFEPASTMKIVHAVTALREVQSGNGTTLNTPITWYANPSDPSRYPNVSNYNNADGTSGDLPDKDVCAYQDDGTPITTNKYVDPLSTILSQMIGQSDNRTTDAMTKRYGFAGLNATIALAGMTKSQVYDRIGCDSDASPQPYKHNQLTLRDAGRIYEGAANGTLLNATQYATLQGYLVGGVVQANTPFGAMITQEATAAGLTPAEISAFLAQTVGLAKGGSYNRCPDSGSCNAPIILDRTGAGILTVPFKNGVGTIVPTSYVYGQWFSIQANCTFAQMTANTCTAFNTEVQGNAIVAVERFRAVIKQAVATW